MTITTTVTIIISGIERVDSAVWRIYADE